MPRGIDDIELVGMSIIGVIHQCDALGLDGNPPFAFDIHGIENLIFHFSFRQTATHLDEAIRKGRFPMVNVGNNGEISDVFGTDNHGVFV